MLVEQRERERERGNNNLAKKRRDECNRGEGKRKIEQLGGKKEGREGRETRSDCERAISLHMQTRGGYRIPGTSVQGINT